MGVKPKQKWPWYLSTPVLVASWGVLAAWAIMILVICGSIAMEAR